MEVIVLHSFFATKYNNDIINILIEYYAELETINYQNIVQNVPKDVPKENVVKDVVINVVKQI